MDLAGYLFLLIFLPINFIVYWWALRQNRAKLVGLSLFSYLFYLLGGWQFIPLLLGLSGFTFWAARRKRFLWGIAANLLALGMFKYLNFGLENLLDGLGVENRLGLISLALPLGLSFYVFKHISYLLDVRQGRYPASNDFLLFNTYSVLWMQISAGPLTSFAETGDQLQKLPQTLPPEQFHLGLSYLVLGLIKKLLLANALAQTLQPILTAEYPTFGWLGFWVFVIFYGVHLYLDFSGYSDMVVGLGYWFGLQLPHNFDNPYLASSPQAFWRRWHISLSQWFQAYIYSPFSRWSIRRSRQRFWIQVSANFLTMSLIGIWHGATWGFILWGIYHAILLNLQISLSYYQWPQFLKQGSRYLSLAAIFAGWGLFLSPNTDFLEGICQSFVGMNGFIAFADYDLLLTNRFTNMAFVLVIGLMAFQIIELPSLLQRVPELRFDPQTNYAKLRLIVLIWLMFYLSYLLLNNAVTLKTETPPFLYTLF